MNVDFYAADHPLFVYGSLRRDFAHPMSAYLWECATFVGEMYLPGRLYHLGAYPGFVSDPDAEERVYGHLALLHAASAERVWRELDAYEGVDLVNPEYARILFHPATPRHEFERIWVYQYLGPTSEQYHIPSGVFRK